jgi:alpha-tubulin suppressor-like RCC1 family protein
LYIHIALFVNGRIICWGAAASGQLGRDSTTEYGVSGNVNTLDYISFSDLVPARSISSKYTHNCAVFVNDRVRCWGLNANYQLSDGTTNDRGKGTGVNSITSATFVDFSPSVNIIPVSAVAVGLYG